MAYAGYKEEKLRLDTFSSWSKPFISKDKLAMFGFYYIGPNDNVKCNFCKVEISAWETGDNVLWEHIRWSPNCPLLKRRPTDNRPIFPEILERSLPPASTSVISNIYSSIERRDNSYPESELPNIPLAASSMNQCNYRKITDRLKSFDEWPKALKTKLVDLSDAGFFYLGKSDKVKCFSCGGGLRDWEIDDDPWEQHALWYGKCSYLVEVKGAEYSAHVKNKYLEKEDQIGKYELNAQTRLNTTNCLFKEETNTGDSKLCKICCDSEMNAALFPCMHIIACVKCAFSFETCPVCRQIIIQVKRIYFS